MSALVTTIIAWLAVGIHFIERADVRAFLFLFVASLWTFIGLAWLTTRKPGDGVSLRYGITFEGIIPTFEPKNEHASLAFALSVRNYCPVPLKYFIEEFNVIVDTRTLPTRYEPMSLQGLLSRGAVRNTSTVPFRLEHIKEFMGRRVEGSLEASIVYGDADKKPVRRLKISMRLFLAFPSAEVLSLPSNTSPNIVAMAFPLGFNSNIKSESDEPYDI